MVRVKFYTWRVKLAKFYRSQKDFRNIHQNLKLTSCPHCKTTGTLILHGYFYGYDSKKTNKITVRGRRVYCSNRHRKTGCGKTFNLLEADRIKRSTFQTSCVWLFLKNIVKGINILKAFPRIVIRVSTTSIYRLYSRVYFNQHKIRTMLLKLCPAPVNIPYANPLIKTIIHLKNTFKRRADPIAAFQSTFQTSFLWENHPLVVLFLSNHRSSVCSKIFNNR